MFVDSHKAQQRLLKPLGVKLLENKALTACEVTPQGLISINKGNTTKEKPGGLLSENFSSSSRICEQLGLVRFQICNEGTAVISKSSAMNIDQLSDCLAFTWVWPPRVYMKKSQRTVFSLFFMIVQEFCVFPCRWLAEHISAPSTWLDSMAVQVKVVTQLWWAFPPLCNISLIHWENVDSFSHSFSEPNIHLSLFSRLQCTYTWGQDWHLARCPALHSVLCEAWAAQFRRFLFPVLEVFWQSWASS